MDGDSQLTQSFYGINTPEDRVIIEYTVSSHIFKIHQCKNKEATDSFGFARASIKSIGMTTPARR